MGSPSADVGLSLAEEGTFSANVSMRVPSVEAGTGVSPAHMGLSLGDVGLASADVGLSSAGVGLSSVGVGASSADQTWHFLQQML
eukprot:7877685-Pyramimonas_sp.AAC.1